MKAITIITSRLRSKRPDLLLLQDFEKYCAQNSNWKTVKGAVLFAPLNISSRVYTFLHTILRPVLKGYKKKGAIVTLGLPYHIYLFSKTFPYFTISSNLSVLWTYDVWQPKYIEFEKLVRDSKVNLLLLSSFQATQHFAQLQIPDCKVHWLPETINPADYKCKPWNERKISILSFGRTFARYHEKILDGCKLNNINYQFAERKDNKDVALHGVKPDTLQFPTWQDFITGLSDTKICICFPKALTHPEQAGEVSTLTLRYLQAMSSKCLIIGSAPIDAKHLFDYNPIVEVDWNDPFTQIKNILQNFSMYHELIEKNYVAVTTRFHYKNAIENIEQFINEFDR